VQKCEELIAAMKQQMGAFWLYNIYDTCASDQAAPHDFDHWHAPWPSSLVRSIAASGAAAAYMGACAATHCILPAPENCNHACTDSA
jgi:hypothetical protein